MADQPSEFATLQDNLKSSLLSTTRTTSSLCAEDLPFQRSLDPGFAKELDRQNARLLSLAERLLGSAVAGGAEVVSASRAGAIQLPDADTLDGSWSSVVDVVDSLLEKADGALDEVRGVVKKSVALGNEGEKPVAAAVKKGTFQKSANILKPQKTFQSSPNNYATGPWKPLLTTKPHAIVPLEKSLHSEVGIDGNPKYDDNFHSTLERNYNATFYLTNYSTLSSNHDIKTLIDSKIRFRHPYQPEIEEYTYPPSMYQEREVIQYLPFESTTATLVDTPEALDEMIAELKKAKEIAVDLEHHDFRSYIGIVCLMQISTRERDWIVDTLKPWRRRLERLNEVFTDPGILKVLHGSSMDIIWLQRDFGVYINGLFDTEQAATALRYPKRSLAYLLEKFVNFQAQKQYQLADWRVRPLAKEMFDYARSDTHFLLYIYDCMHNELVQNNNLSDPEGDLIEKVLRGSKSYLLQRYEAPIYDAAHGMGQSGWYKQLYRTPALLSKQQFAVFKAVHQWRDALARREDDSFMYVMSNHTLMALSKEMPTTKEDLYGKTPSVTASMRQHIDELVDVIRDAKEAGINGPEMRVQLQECDEIADARHNDRVQSKQATLAGIMAQAKKEVAAKVIAAEPMSAGKRPEVVSVDLGAVKADGSSFWGATLRSPMQKRHVSSDVRLALPMPDVTAEVFATNGTPSMPVELQHVNQTSVTSSPAPPPIAKAEEFFTIKDMGGRSKKRKASEVATSESVKRDMEDGLQEIGEDEAATKAAKRQEKARKREKKLAKKDAAETQKVGVIAAPVASSFPVAKKPETDAAAPPPASSFPTARPEGGTGAAFMAFLTAGKKKNNAEAEEEEAFDYANAPSVLEGSGKRDKKRKNKKGKMSFDPYAKASNAPNGLPRVQKERAGKSGTFKS